MKRISLLILLICYSSVLRGQDIEGWSKVLKTKKSDLIKVSGGISGNSIAYTSSGLKSRRQPFTWALNGSLNFQIAGKISLPFSFNYSNQRFTYQRPQPPNIAGLSPQYKWITAHIGNRNMSFSNYTLSGMAFSGVGVELTPGKFNISAMYGRINRAVQSDSLVSPDAPSIYERRGYGAKVGYQGEGHSVELMFFYAEDNPNSISFIPSDSLQTPAENLSIGTKVQVPFLKKFRFTAETGISAYTRNTRLEPISYTGRYAEIFTPVFDFRASTSVYHALKSNLSYQHQNFSLGIGYKYIDPEYRTMGAYFFNNDLENITLNLGLKLLRGRLNISSNVGKQRNNLNDTESAQTSSWIMATNISTVLMQKLNVNVIYSNMQNVSRVRPILSKFDTQADSLNLSQVNQNANLSFSYNLQGKKHQQGFQWNVSYQTANSIRNGLLTDNQSTNWNTVFSYRYSVPKTKFNCTLSMNRNQSTQGKSQTIAWGPTVVINKGWLKEEKLRGTLSSTYNIINQQHKLSNAIYNVRSNMNYKISDKQQLSSSLSWIHRSGTSSRPQTIQEFTWSINYNYTF